MLLRHLHQLLNSSHHNNKAAARAEIKALTAVLRVVHGGLGYSVRRHRYAVDSTWFGEFLERLERLELANDGLSVFAYLGIKQEEMGWGDYRQVVGVEDGSGEAVKKEEDGETMVGGPGLVGVPTTTTESVIVENLDGG